MQFALTVQSDSTDNNKLCRSLQGPDRPLLPCPRLCISSSIIIPVTVFLFLCVSLFFLFLFYFLSFFCTVLVRLFFSLFLSFICFSSVCFVVLWQCLSFTAALSLDLPLFVSTLPPRVDIHPFPRLELKGNLDCLSVH